MYNCSGTLLFVVMFISVPMMRTRSRSDKEKQVITGHSGGAGGLPPSMLQASGGAVGGPSGMYMYWPYCVYYLLMLFLAKCSVLPLLLVLLS